MQLCEARKEYVRWLIVTRDLSPHTIRAYECDIIALERHLGSCTLASRIGRRQLLDFIAAQRGTGLSSASIRRRAAALRGFCVWLQSRGLLNSDPWPGTSVGASRERKLPRLVPVHELDRLLLFLRQAAGVDDACDPPRALPHPHESTTLLAVALMVATGVRVTEAVTIRCQDLDLRGHTVRIVGKGRRERHVFLTDGWIRSLTRSYMKTRTVLGIEQAPLLFNSRHSVLTAAALRSRLIKAGRDAGLRTRVTPHMLRHTAATQLIEAGVDIRFIQRLLGHASLTTTEIYTHVSDEALRQTVSDADVLGRLISRGAQK